MDYVIYFHKQVYVTVRRIYLEKFKEIEEEIYEMRQALQFLIMEKSILQDEEVIAASQELDRMLNKYDRLMKKQ